jgi:hypothetical protein
MYKGWFKRNIGNIFENGLGMFFGNVPYNFSHSHVAIHHQYNGGCGDTFYMWDIDRSSLFDFMLYVHRIFMYMSGWSSYKFFLGHNMYSKADALKSGMLQYYCFGLVVMAITRSPSFVYWIYFQPLISMGYFLAMINVGYHGFIEFDQLGKTIPVVNSTTLIEGEDDSFGEDDHMAHHYNSGVFYRDLKALQKSKEEEFIRCKASVFRGLSIVELSIFILLGLWDKIADHYVDYSNSMTKEEIKAMLITRAQRIELEYEQYADFMEDPSLEKRKMLSAQIDDKFGGKGVFITKSNSESQLTASSDDDGYTSNDCSHDKSQ